MNKVNRLHYSKNHNYTEWRKDFFGDTGVKEINSAAVEYAKHCPIIVEIYDIIIKLDKLQ